MSYLERIQTDLTAAMKEKNELRLSVLRMMKSALKLKEVEKMKPLDDLESLQILQTLVKKGKESIEQFTQGGRPDLAEKEKRDRDYRAVPSGCAERRRNDARDFGGGKRIGRGFAEANGRGGEGRARQTRR